MSATQPPDTSAARSCHAYTRAACKHAQTIVQSGAASIEFALVAIPLLLIGLGGIEIAHWFSVRQMVSVALLEAARAASVAHAKPETIENAFEHALLPLFAGLSQDQARQRLTRAFERRQQDTQDSPWRIVIHSPTASAYRDYAQAEISIQGLPTINNNYQQEQDLHYRRLGWPEGRGTASGVSIFQANTLRMTLTYPHKPVLPGISNLLKQLYPMPDSYARAAMQHGYLPMTRSMALIMQSHPVDWPSLANGKVIHEHRLDDYAMPARKEDILSGCVGAWCSAKRNGHGSNPTGRVWADPGPVPGNLTSAPELALIDIHTGKPGSNLEPRPGLNDVGDPDESVDDGELCGVVLCCE